MRTTNRAWAVAGVLLLVWVGLGYQYDASTGLTWLPKLSLTCSVLAPVLFIAMYTALGLTGPNKWWKTDVGTNIVWLMIADIVDHGLIWWAVVFHQGMLDTPSLAWAYVGSQLAAALIVAWRGVIWLRAEQERRRGNGANGTVPAPGEADNR